MPLEHNQKEVSDRHERKPEVLTVAAITAICLLAYFLIDWTLGSLIDSLPEGLQTVLIVVGILITLFEWIRRASNWVESDLKRIEARERDALKASQELTTASDVKSDNP